MRQLVILTLAALLAGCAAPGAPAGPTAGAGPATSAAAPEQPTAPPPPPPAAGFTPVARPPGPLLPAPLYLLDRGQIARIERDGATRAQLTRERIAVEGYPPISSFDVARTGDLAYVVGDLAADRLVRADSRGGNLRTLYEQPGHELSDLVWSPDGGILYIRLLNNKEPPDIPSGVYRMSAAGGTPELVRADDPVDDIANPSPLLSGYRPFAIAPDGAMLLVEVFSLFYDGCALGVLPSAGGELVRIATPEGTQLYCGEAAWSPDGAAVYFLAGPPAGPGVGPTVWRAEAASGAASAVGAADLLARAPQALPDGAVRFFQVALPASADGVASFTPTELGGAAPVALGPAFSEQLELALWAPDGSGAVVSVVPADVPVTLRWLPAGGGESVELPSTRERISGLRWGGGE